MKFHIGDKVKVKDGVGKVYRVSDVGVYQCEIVTSDNGSFMGWYNEDDLVSATDPHKATEKSAKAANISPYDEPYTLPWEHEYPRNDCNASGGDGTVIKVERHESSNCDTNSLEAEYERGLNDAWELVRRLRTTAPTDIIEIFDKDTTFSVIEELSASEAIKKWKAWEDKNEFKVGDEVVCRDGIKGIVVGISNNTEQISLLSNEYNVPQLLIKSHATKTGRHFDQIEEVLKQMKEEE